MCSNERIIQLSNGIVAGTIDPHIRLSGLPHQGAGLEYPSREY
jgi:hypothetical protein